MRARRPGGESKWLWIVTIVAVAVGALAFLNRPDPPDESADDPAAAPSATPEPSATPTPRQRRKKAEAEETPEAVDLPSGLPMPPGLGGSGSGKSLPRTAYQIKITSAKPMYRVQYIIPTSDDQQYGEDNGVGTSWVHNTTVWGRPDYGAAFVHALWPGVEVTCVVSVGGRVVERRTIVGPYGAMWCQG
ncbi:hypothetical protein CFH99_05675 [Nocardioides aromaticivorans]|uniref:Secreted protein n=1 Tax=Nocardioides aromaticivorans TaxID=200618 RepID=A0ABX7PGX8_9ACTN|nr:hypothetical protein CFH99_05675 [Nocardioides aromaticivorans]